jgi:hypothetical protein
VWLFTGPNHPRTKESLTRTTPQNEITHKLAEYKKTRISVQPFCLALKITEVGPEMRQTGRLARKPMFLRKLRHANVVRRNAVPHGSVEMLPPTSSGVAGKPAAITLSAAAETASAEGKISSQLNSRGSLSEGAAALGPAHVLVPR